MKNVKEIFTYDELPEAYDYLPDVCVDVEAIRVIMVNEVVPIVEQDDFYGNPETSPYSASICSLFAQAGIQIANAHALLDKGIYLTNAVKEPKEESAISTVMIKRSVPLLEKELALFPNVEIVMAMGDVAIKAINYVMRNRYKTIVIPSGSTYKLRKNKYYFQDVQYMPSYIITGKNLEIEKSKRTMIVEDLQYMLEKTKIK